ATAPVKVSTRRSGAKSRWISGRPAERKRTSAVLLQEAIAKPSAAPRALNVRLSTRSCRMRRPRGAPMARRTAIARPRAGARAAGGGAGEEQVGYVGACDEQHQSDHAHQHVERSGEFATQAGSRCAGAGESRAPGDEDDLCFDPVLDPGVAAGADLGGEVLLN